MRFFSYESKFSQLVLKLCYACFLNLLWFLCSIPIVTIGASTAALYYTSFKIIREEDNHAGAMFFRAFRDNFKQATVLWLIMLAFGIFLSGDIYILYHLRRTTEGPMAVIWTLMLAFVIVAAVFYIIILEYVFPLVASVKNTSIAMLKNSFLIGTHYLFAMFFVIVAWFTPLIVLGEGLCAMISAWLLNRIMIASSGTPEDKAEEMEEENTP